MIMYVFLTSTDPLEHTHTHTLWPQLAPKGSMVRRGWTDGCMEQVVPPPRVCVCVSGVLGWDALLTITCIINVLHTDRRTAS